ncbi:Uncharacterised protein [Mycobacteroides abscessus subsp. abscessus]|nr:Uncharacterised protein [Mycobacteroides abscessus subsp. abscessus]SKU57931.1 Uncharacterised protein [Mycobacteroides abscessus subsp. abscessus]
MFGNHGLHARRVVHGIVQILDVGTVYAKDEVDGVTTQLRDKPVNHSHVPAPGRKVADRTTPGTHRGGHD